MTTTSPTSRKVYLFRKPSIPDAYLDAFRSAFFDPECISVLQEIYELEELATVVNQGGQSYDAVVISSKRGAEGWVRAAEQARQMKTSWSTTPLYAVGKSTFDVLTSTSYSDPASALPSLSEYRIAKSGSALVDLIRRDDTGRPPTGHWLIVRGDKSNEEVANGLRGMGKRVTEVIVYRTLEDPDLRSSLHALHSGWLVFFAPSSAEMVLAHLSQRQELSPRAGAASSRYRIAAIGQTTRKFLEDRGYRVDAVADEPTAYGLLHSVKDASTSW
ncbi:tetrapyrrole biosynthesis, uroporphyrinogen III synthase [Kockovaella imperatae]|uniref:Tetrapyrrole biosynthesis, uroporphyrinogen III synthase n=1 Tax=Kockovaella imperatae TaxID=4999 RepID=A0A1Y1U7S5_9TREE|nr:tetrapyrrole biosynthesis, uroporphyrinogen III synthase [Kockovaella imperatae]ORX33594.1 tetrapyrrole biosynthesis, uroporphyrinogen III synthase [Kockovaella imperatae]